MRRAKVLLRVVGIGLVVCLGLCALLWTLWYRLGPEGYIWEIQRVLDDQCGEGVVTAYSDGLDYGGFGVYWYGSGADCERYFSGEWSCRCPSTPTPAGPAAN
jgi:hypothetical protein